MSTPMIGSILLGSAQPAESKEWYVRAFGATENDMGALGFGEVQLFIESHSEISGTAKEPARCIINLTVSDCRELGRHLNDMGTTFVRQIEQMPFGLIGTVTDPDGNYVQIIEWGATPDAGHG